MTESREVLIDGYTFLVSTDTGAIDESGGLYHRDTRHLSAFDVTVDNVSLSNVGAELRTPSERTLYFADVSSSVNRLSESAAQKHTDVVLAREQSLSEGEGLTERVQMYNHAAADRELTLRVAFYADFADLFEVRGFKSGIDRTAESTVAADHVRYGYEYDTPTGRRTAETTVTFDTEPDALTDGEARFTVDLGSQTDWSVEVTVDPSSAGGGSDSDALPEIPVPATGRDSYDRTFEQAAADIRALTTLTDHGPVPLAGVPWFATVFGRDSLVAAYQLLPFVPEVAEGTLRYLAAQQGTEYDDRREEAPGKIPHEHRHGELAAKGLVPHTPYYGTIDATLLWLVLLEETVRWTGDEEILADLWPNAEAAVDWVDTAVDRIGDDPFLYYTASPEHGLHHKGWRDTEASIQFADGEYAEAPLATAEVQGYVYDAYRRVARLLGDCGSPDRARTYRERAETLAERFDERFWLSDRRYYATAVDDDGRLVDSLTSNVGHCLWSDVIPEHRAPDVADRLLGPALNAGWGIRTMSSDDGGYSPVSYHAGSIWPHDVSLIALGLTQYGFHDAAESVALDVLDASTRFEQNRLPELFCGFTDAVRPQEYPAACNPQAWGAGAAYLLLRALFDISVGDDDTIQVGHRPNSLSEDGIVQSLASNESSNR
ncbi:amylo-alpha-1,6-glucosidase [Halorussus salinisoli]|uniref:amylo-alpha-1,6-glucosidase n=1 Tax=Halorussus salinisoli TaxID=2558242 RepID=UPI0010C18878|nr:glycogen debranching N-terminal domain-containing protein [Halorussus salinisoli]